MHQPSLPANTNIRARCTSPVSGCGERNPAPHADLTRAVFTLHKPQRDGKDLPYLRNKGQQVTVPATREQVAARMGCAGRSGSLTRRKRRNAAGLWMRSGQRQPGDAHVGV